MFNLTFQSFEWWLAFVVLGAMSAALIYVSGRIEKKKNLFLAMRMVVYALLFLILFQPSKTVFEKSGDKPVVAFLVDTSMSMKVEDPAERFSYVKDFLKDNGLLKAHHYMPCIFSFSAGSQRTTVQNVLSSSPEGRITDIALSLSQVQQEFRGRIMQGVVLVSDGAHNGTGDPVEVAASLKVPVYTVGVGNEEGFNDLQIAGIRVSDFAFKNTPVDADVQINVFGFQGTKIPVILKCENEVIQTKNLDVKDKSESIKIVFRFTPRTVGTFNYTVAIPPYRSELTLKNNTRTFSLRVLRDKIRVLYICGQPSWEYSFLRNFLKGDPSVELVSFIILRNPENITIVPEDQLSLIPFPTEEIFTREIFNFDLAIMENFTYSRFGIPLSYLAKIREFVLAGGGFLMLGGDNSFGRGGYKDTPIDDILPVVMNGWDEDIVAGQFKMRVAQSGHPILQLSDDEKETRRVWEEMPILDSCNKFIGAKPGAVVLGVHPMARNENGNLVILSVCDAGKGRVMAMASNSTWRWSFEMAAKGKSSYYYNRFWYQAVRWLIKAQDMKLVHLTSDKKVYSRNEDIKLNVRVFDEYYRPNNNARVTVCVLNPQGRSIELGAAVALPGSEGEYELGCEEGTEGRYEFSATAQKAGRRLGSDKITCEVSSPSLELENAQINENLLRAIADATGAKYFHISDFRRDSINFPVLKAEETLMKRKVSVWANPAAYILLAVLLVAEWYIRRRAGLM